MREKPMPLNLNTGDSFPDVKMLDHEGNTAAISEIALGQPLFLAFYRGPW
jgi:peroxiredoxin